MPRIDELAEFDTAEDLEDDEAVAQDLTIVLEENGPSALADALGTIARVHGMAWHGMASIAQGAGIGREAQCKASRPGTHPRFDTVQRVGAAPSVEPVARPAC